MRSVLISGACAAFLSVSPVYSGETDQALRFAIAETAETHTQEAHEHGKAELLIAWNTKELSLEFRSPIFNLTGSMSKMHDHEFVEERIKQLTNLESLLVFNQEAGCNLQEVSTQEREAHEEEHRDLTLNAKYSCEDFASLKSINAAKMFSVFPALEKIEASWISPVMQSSGVLSTSKFEVNLN